MVQVKVSETYDLSTKVGKLGMVAIHTPTGDLINRLWGGLVAQHKYFRFAKCDVAMACASMLPADPLQIGVEAGAIAPQDMFNPILYKAVSNDSMSNLELFMQGNTSGPVLNKNSIKDFNSVDFKDSGDNFVDQFQMYYSLLANPQGWKKAMPQQGLTMSGLYPIVYSVVSNYGVYNPDNYNGVGGLDSVPPTKVDSNPVNNASLTTSVALRGPSMRMPKIPTTSFEVGKPNSPWVANDVSQDLNTDRIKPVYVGAIVLPPAKLNQLYYRLKVTWTIEFSGLRPQTDLFNWRYMADMGEVAYGSDYSIQSASMTSVESMVDARDADLSKIMEGE